MAKQPVKLELSANATNEQLGRILRPYLSRVGAVAKARAQQIIGEELNDRSGRLKSSIDFRVNGNGRNIEMELVSTAGEYALYQHEGTGIYGPNKQPIRPKRGQLLTWVDPDTGERIWAKEVRGTPGKKFLTKGVEFALKQVKI